MGLSSVVSYSDLASQRSAGDVPFLLHSNPDWAPQELVDHIVQVHHAIVRQSLADLVSRLPAIGEIFSARADHWDKIIRQFGELHDAILMGIRQEASSVFPQLLSWYATWEEQPPPSELLDAAKTVTRAHARCLQMLWRLLRLTRDELSIPVGTRHQQKLTDRTAEILFDEFSALCDYYERHLFEVECLLLPIVTSRSRSSGLHSATTSVNTPTTK